MFTAAAARPRYAHINDEDNSLGVIPNLLTRRPGGSFGPFDAHDDDDVSSQREEETNPRVISSNCRKSVDRVSRRLDSAVRYIKNRSQRVDLRTNVEYKCPVRECSGFIFFAFISPSVHSEYFYCPIRCEFKKTHSDIFCKQAKKTEVRRRMLADISCHVWFQTL